MIKIKTKICVLDILQIFKIFADTLYIKGNLTANILGEKET